jgi:hypothetical protein
MTRKANDFYPTPVSIIDAILRRVRWLDDRVWEPCAGDNRLAGNLALSGYKVVSGDIQTGQDFFKYDKALAPAIITNPPFKSIRGFIDHAFNIGVFRMALVCSERIWASKIGMEQFNRHRPRYFANMSWREDYLGKGGSPDRALAVAIWDTPHSAQCEYQVWDKP